MIYVCVPAHNEADTIGVLLWKTRKVLGEFGRDYRIVVHDDGSSDDTQAVLDRYKRSLPLTVLRSQERVGYSRSVEKLLRWTVDDSSYHKRDCAVVLQADFTENPTDVVDLVKIFEGGADIVAGAVETDSDSLPKGPRLVRRFARWLLRGVFGRAPVSDPLCGLRVYRLIVLKKAFRGLRAEDALVQSEGWAANVELLAKLVPHARRIEEVPLSVRYDLQVRPSRFRPWPTFLALARLRSGALWKALPDAEAA